VVPAFAEELEERVDSLLGIHGGAFPGRGTGKAPRARPCGGSVRICAAGKPGDSFPVAWDSD
jgi:hypothetical protein